MVTVHRHGFTRLGKDATRGGPYRWNIIFIHGLRGHPQNTWGRGSDEDRDTETDPGTKSRSRFKTLFKHKKSRPESDRSDSNPNTMPEPRPFWPAEFVTNDIPEAIVWTYGYNAEVMKGLFEPNNQNSVSQHGQDLAGRFERDIDNEYPVIFLAHSLGGIILKEAIRRSNGCRSRTKLIIFLGTPHRGSRAAGWGVTAAKLARLAFSDPNITLVESLNVDSLALDKIHDDFINIVHECQVQVHSFQEGRGVSTIPGHIDKVVDDFSSKLGLPQALEKVETIDADHRQMVKCTGKEDHRYRTIIGVIQHFLRISSSKTNSAAITTTMASFSLESEATQLDTTKKNRVCFCIPFMLNPRFIGRDEILSRISTILFTDNRYQKVALVGLGGIGKSQIAIQFAFWARENKPDYSVFWLSALSKASFEQTCREIMTECDLQATASDDTDAKRVVQKYLSSNKAGRWLLILDNVDDAWVLGESIHDFLPKSRDGLILITTRSQEIATSLAKSEVIRVPEMCPAEAKSYLAKLLIDKDLIQNEAATVSLLRALTHLPLAITQAAEYINTNSVSIAQYHKLFSDTDENMVELLSNEFHDETRYKESTNAVVASWLVSFHRISETDMVAARLLLFLAWIEPKAIPQSIFPEQSELRLSRAIGTLLGYGFLFKRKESGVFDMHSLAHLVTQVWGRRQANGAHILREAMFHMVEIFPPIDWENRDVWRQYVPHALKFLREAPELDGVGCKLGKLVGLSLNKDMRAQEAIEVLELVLNSQTMASLRDHPDRLTSQHELAHAYLDNGQIKEAIRLLEIVVSIQTALAEDHPNRLASQHELARAYLDNRQIKEAIRLLEIVVSIQTALAEDHPHRLASQHTLAYAYLDNGQIKEAIRLLEIVVSIRTALAEDHPSRLASQHILATAYLDNGQVEEAVKLMEHVVLIRKKTLAEDHPRRLTSEGMLAYFYEVCKK